MKFAVIRLALRYFALVFACGFLLGTIRVLLIVPRLGERQAELIEAPLMVLVCWLASAAIARQCSHPGKAVWVGLLALALMLTLEFTLVLGLRGMTVQGWLDSRDPVSGSVYLVSLVLFALFPAVRVYWRARSLG